MPFHHPNKTIRPKGRNMTLRRITNLWPLLFWFGCIAVAFWSYRQGVVFRRMNGAVDVYQENISPAEDGNFEKLAEGIFRGARVVEGQPVAFMRSSALDEEIAILRQAIEARRQERLQDFRSDMLKVESELRKIETELVSAKAEVEASQKEIADRMKSMGGGTDGKLPPAYQQALLNNPAFIELNVNIAKSDALAKHLTIDQTKVENDLNILKQQISSLREEKDLNKVAEGDQAAELAHLLLKQKMLVLRASRAGTVDLIIKEPGEYVKAGEGILKIVGDPTQIIGFLAQDQLGQVAEGKPVWITPTQDRTKVFQTTVHYLAPRMNSLPDSTGPTANSRLFGRDVICDLPKDGTWLPGQTVIIWIEPPGSVPLLNKLLTNDDVGLGK